MSDIVEQLRTAGMHTNFPNMLGEAADEIERLRADLKRMDWEQRRHTIERCAQVVEQWFQDAGENDSSYVAPLATAIRALKGKAGADPNLVYPGKDADFVFPEE